MPICPDVKVLVISGSMGSGKTTVLGEASDLLTLAQIHHAAIDLDSLAVGHWPINAAADLTMRNLALIWGSYATLGIGRLLLGEAMDTVAKRERLKDAIPGAQIVVGRLMAKLETMQERIRLREPGMLQEQFVSRVAELEMTLNRAQVEDFSVQNDNRSVTDVARELLVSANWL